MLAYGSSPGRIGFVSCAVSCSFASVNEGFSSFSTGFVTTSKVGLTLFTNGLAFFLDTFLAAAPIVTSAFFFVEWTAWRFSSSIPQRSNSVIWTGGCWWLDFWDSSASSVGFSCFCKDTTVSFCFSSMEGFIFSVFSIFSVSSTSLTSSAFVSSIPKYRFKLRFFLKSSWSIFRKSSAMPSTPSSCVYIIAGLPNGSVSNFAVVWIMRSGCSRK